MHNLRHHYLWPAKHPRIVICNLDETGRDHNVPSAAATRDIAIHIPDPAESCRLREDQQAGVRGALHDGDQVLQASGMALRTGGPRCEGGAECRCRSRDGGVASRDVCRVNCRNGVEIGGQDTPAGKRLGEC
jgi:hypothetical protein